MGDSNLPSWDQSEQIPRVAIDVTSERVNYHRDTVEYLVQCQVDRCASEGIKLSKEDINNFRTEIVKTLIIKNKAEEAVNKKLEK